MCSGVKIKLFLRSIMTEVGKNDTVLCFFSDVDYHYFTAVIWLIWWHIWTILVLERVYLLCFSVSQCRSTVTELKETAVIVSCVTQGAERQFYFE